jgi:hypothetical protein
LICNFTIIRCWASAIFDLFCFFPFLFYFILFFLLPISWRGWSNGRRCRPSGVHLSEHVPPSADSLPIGPPVPQALGSVPALLQWRRRRRQRDGRRGRHLPPWPLHAGPPRILQGRAPPVESRSGILRLQVWFSWWLSLYATVCVSIRLLCV